MFAPEGFTPLGDVENWVTWRGDAFFAEFAVRRAFHQREGISEDDRLKLVEEAFAGRQVYVGWLMDFCLWQQPVPIYLSSVDGRILRASNRLFIAKDNLSYYDFTWPMDDDELRPVVESMGPSEVLGPAYKALEDRFGYHFFDPMTATIRGAERDQLPDELRLHSTVAERFVGWSVCVRDSDLDQLDKALTEAFEWSESGSPAPPRGRPRKIEIARAHYTILYPDGHDVQGATWGEAAREVGRACNQSISIHTLRRAVGANPSKTCL